MVKIMKNRLIIVFFAMLTGFITYAQEEEENLGKISMSETAELIQGDIINFDTPIKDNIVQLQQIGDNNKLNANQNLIQNTVYILTAEQTGNSNEGFIEQNGGAHESLLMQSGNSNVANLFSIGYDTKNGVFQIGNNNLANSSIENNSLTPKSIQSYQLGDHNQINLSLQAGTIDPTLGGLLIEQRGDNNMADVMIDNYNVPYMKIEQTGGAKVIIHNSDFNYPVK